MQEVANIASVFASLVYLNIVYHKEMCIYIYKNCLCGSVAKASDTQAVGHGLDPRPDH